MTLAQFALAEASIAQVRASEWGKKPPPKRTSIAMADRRVAPEPR